MQDLAYSSPLTLPFSFRGRSPVDGIRLRWAGIGDVALATVCFVSIRNVGGMILGLLLVALAIATWAVTRLETIHWYDLASAGKAVVGTGAVVELGFLYLFFLTSWMVVGAFKLFVFFSK
jgi:hypothetical protein